LQANNGASEPQLVLVGLLSSTIPDNIAWYNSRIKIFKTQKT